MGIWQIGKAGARISRSHEAWQEGFRASLVDLSESDICGSCFAVVRYQTDEELRGDEALARVHKQLNQCRLRLMLDFVPNHTALDHPWVQKHPGFYVQGSTQDIDREPQNYIALKTNQGRRVFAYGRDPYFDGWPDVLQLDYSQPCKLQLLAIAPRCDGVRCHMAMLILPEVFERTWGKTIEPFWPKAITAVRKRFPDFVLLAEVYWNLEWTLQLQGFDFTYDKRLYDRLRVRVRYPIREHLGAGLYFQQKLARFLENHDEPCAAETFPHEIHKAAAIITFLSLGLRFFHDGQLAGKSVHIPIHLCRDPDEAIDKELSEFYSSLLQTLQKPVFRHGKWALAKCCPIEQGNESWEHFIVYCWQDEGKVTFIAVNHTAHPGQCWVVWQEPPVDENPQQDLMSSKSPALRVEINAEQMLLDFPAWGYHVFTLQNR